MSTAVRHLSTARRSRGRCTAMASLLALAASASAETGAAAIVFPLRHNDAVDAQQFTVAADAYRASCERQLGLHGVRIMPAAPECLSAIEGCGEQDLRCWHARCGADATVTVVQGEVSRLGESYTVVVTARRLAEREAGQSAQVRVATWDGVAKAIEEAVGKAVTPGETTGASGPTTQAVKPLESPTPPAKQGAGLRTAAWIAAGMGVVAAGVGGTFAVVASGASGELEDPANGRGYYLEADLKKARSAVERGDQSMTLSAGMFGAAVGAAAAAVVFFYLAPSARTAVEAGPGGAAVTIRF